MKGGVGGAHTHKSDRDVDKNNSSMLGFIYDDVTQRLKNIEDFGAPVGQINRVLHSILA
jgi:hypothetical protein